MEIKVGIVQKINAKQSNIQNHPITITTRPEMKGVELFLVNRI